MSEEIKKSSIVLIESDLSLDLDTCDKLENILSKKFGCKVIVLGMPIHTIRIFNGGEPE